MRPIISHRSIMDNATVRFVGVVVASRGAAACVSRSQSDPSPPEGAWSQAKLGAASSGHVPNDSTRNDAAAHASSSNSKADEVAVRRKKGAAKTCRNGSQD